VDIVCPLFSLVQIKGFMRSLDSVQNYHNFKAQEIPAAKGRVSAEDLKPFDVTECFEREIREKLGLNDVGDDQVIFEVVYRIFIRMAHKLIFAPDD